MIPKIIFRYSGSYNKSFRNSPRLKKTLSELGVEYPSVKKIKKYIGKVEILWRKDEKVILKEMSKITKLKWKT